MATIAYIVLLSFQGNWPWRRRPCGCARLTSFGAGAAAERSYLRLVKIVTVSSMRTLQAFNGIDSCVVGKTHRGVARHRLARTQRHFVVPAGADNGSTVCGVGLHCCSGLRRCRGSRPRPRISALSRAPSSTRSRASPSRRPPYRSWVKARGNRSTTRVTDALGRYQAQRIESGNGNLQGVVKDRNGSGVGGATAVLLRPGGQRTPSSGPIR